MSRDDGVMAVDNTQAPARQAQMAKRDFPIANIAKEFAAAYYDNLRNGGPLHKFYGLPSRFSRIDEVGAEFNEDMTHEGYEAITDHLKTICPPGVKMEVECKTIDYQFLGNVNGVLLVTTGVMDGRMFTQSFVLAEQVRGYYVQNDTLRFISNSAEPPRDAALQKPIPITKIPTNVLPRQVAASYRNGTAAAATDAAPVVASPVKAAAVAAASPQRAPLSPAVVASADAAALPVVNDAGAVQGQQQEPLSLTSYHDQQVEQQRAIQAARAEAKQAQEQAAPYQAARAQAHAVDYDAGTQIAGERTAEAGAASSSPAKLNGVQGFEAQEAPAAAAYDAVAQVEPQAAVEEEDAGAVEDRQVRFPADAAAAAETSPEKARPAQQYRESPTNRRGAPQQQYRRADQRQDEQSPRRGAAGGQQQRNKRQDQNGQQAPDAKNPNAVAGDKQQGGRRTAAANNQQQQQPRGGAAATNGPQSGAKPHNSPAPTKKTAQSQVAGAKQRPAPQQQQHKLSPHENEVKTSYVAVPEKKAEPAGIRSWSSLVGGSSRPAPPTVNSHPPLPTKTTTTTNGVSSAKRGGGGAQQQQQQQQQNGGGRRGNTGRRGKRGDGDAGRTPQAAQRGGRGGGGNNDPSTSSNEQYVRGGIFVKNLPRDWKEEAVRDFFSKEGAIKSIEMRHFAQKGFITLSFANARVAEDCCHKTFPELPDLKVVQQKNPRFGSGGGRGRGGNRGGDDRDGRGGSGRFSRGGRGGGGGNRGARGGGRGGGRGGRGGGDRGPPRGGGGGNASAER